MGAAYTLKFTNIHHFGWKKTLFPGYKVLGQGFGLLSETKPSKSRRESAAKFLSFGESWGIFRVNGVVFCGSEGIRADPALIQLNAAQGREGRMLMPG